MTAKTTQRLVIEEITLSDGPHMLRLMNTPGWLQFIGDRNIHSVQDAENYIHDRMLTQYQQLNYGLFKLSSKADHAFIGICGMVQRPNLPTPDLGFAMFPEYEGKGLMEEAACCILQVAVEAKWMKECWAMTDPQNAKAQKLLEKLGFEYDSDLTRAYAKDGLIYYKMELRSKA